jgi:hypothetical protein
LCEPAFDSRGAVRRQPVEKERPASYVLLLREEMLLQDGDEGLGRKMSLKANEDPPSSHTAPQTLTLKRSCSTARRGVGCPRGIQTTSPVSLTHRSTRHCAAIGGPQRVDTPTPSHATLLMLRVGSCGDALTSRRQVERSAITPHRPIAHMRSLGGHLMLQTNRSQPGATADELTQALPSAPHRRRADDRLRVMSPHHLCGRSARPCW